MAIKYGKFELPSKVKLGEVIKAQNFTRFIAEPFERGFGHTVGNALRRLLLTSMEAPAIISVRMENVPHEYMAIEGIVEDMTHIILNLKSALVRKMPTDDDPRARALRVLTTHLEITTDQIDKGKGQHVVTLKEIIRDADFEVINPDLPIFTVTKPQSRKIVLKIAMGRGYVPSERHPVSDRITDEILIDAAFSPVRLVNYYVENTRVGQDTDFDRLILEVTTDGRITPEEALSIATQIGIIHFEVFKQVKNLALTIDQGAEEANTDRDALMQKLAQEITEMELSVRSNNCLSLAHIKTIGELVVMPRSELLKFKNFGKKSLNEIELKLEEMGLSLEMDLGIFDIHQHNIKQVLQEYSQEKSRKES